MAVITDEYMKQMMTTTRGYTLVILKAGPNRQQEGVQEIVWEHGRKNFSLRTEGKLVIVCPVNDGSEINGIGIFNADAQETKKIMDEDPGVQQGVFRYEIHPTRSFPGDTLPQ